MCYAHAEDVVADKELPGPVLMLLHARASQRTDARCITRWR